jgi:hypothetical protein
MVQGKDPGNDPYVARVARNLKRGLDTMDTISGFSGKSHEKIVQEIDSRNRENGVHGARPAIIIAWFFKQILH